MDDHAYVILLRLPTNGSLHLANDDVYLNEDDAQKEAQRLMQMCQTPYTGFFVAPLNMVTETVRRPSVSPSSTFTPDEWNELQKLLDFANRYGYQCNSVLLQKLTQLRSDHK